MSNQFVSRRSLLSGALWLTAGGLLAACGGQPAAPTAAPAKPAAEPTKPAAAEPTKPAAAPAAATPTAAPAAKPAAGGVTKVVVWAGDLATADESTPTGKWAKWIRTTFQEKNPKYEVDAQDKGWDQALRTGLLTAIAGNAVPDITTGEAFVHEFAALGAFNVVPDLPIKHFAYGPVAGSIYQGQLYGVPIRTSPFALETNKRTAEQAGLDPTKPPKTWDELVANSEKAKAAGGDKFVGFNLYGPAPNRIYGTVLRTIPWINQTGKPLGDDDGTKAFMNSPEHVAAYELSRKLFKTADPGNTFSGDEGKLYAFLWQDKAVYQVSAIWNVYNARDNKAETIYHPLPRKDPNVSGNVVLGNAVYSVLKKAKNLEGGVLLQKFMAEEETQRQIGILLGNRLPTVASVLSDPKLEQLPAYAPVAASIRTFADILLKEDVRPVPPYAKNPDKVWIAWGDTFGKILQSSDPIQPILDRLQADVEKLIK
jgi:ABC-type glycerol-3-phosphate transport system substrate-binding protein